MFDKYLKKYNKINSLIQGKPDGNLFNIIVIPCLNEPEILKTLQSLNSCQLPNKSVEVIIVINSSELANAEVVGQNKLTYIEITDFAKRENNSKLKFHPIIIDNVPKKKAGAGYARKQGMDEAVFRFNQVSVDGVITSLDADTILENNYLVEIENTFLGTNTNAATIYFEHSLNEQIFGEELINGIKKYELYLRYFRQALIFIGFPFATHTIGSAFASRASIYVNYGGLKATQAGEDFYFVQKVIQAGNYKEIIGTKVTPSPRLSERVIFGTGPAVIDILKSENQEYFVYSIESFIDLKQLVDRVDSFFNTKENQINEIISSLPSSIIEFLGEIDFAETVLKINSNTKTIETFRKAFFNNFNTFTLIRFLNESHKNYYKKQEVEIVADLLLEQSNFETKAENLSELLNVFKDADREKVLLF